MWYFGSWGILGLYIFILSILSPLSFAMIVTVQLLATIYVVSLLVSSYRPTRQLGCGGWIIFLSLLGIANFIASESIGYFIKTHIGRISLGIGPSMYPTLKSMPSDISITNALVYRSSNPHRGDIVRFMSREKNKDSLWAKRVVGLPGETIDICPPYVLINGEKLLDPPIFAKISSCENEYSGYVETKDMGLEGLMLPITLGPEEYFLLGDNSLQSWDSRHIGPVPRKAIQGKVVRIVFPPWRIREL